MPSRHSLPRIAVVLALALAAGVGTISCSSSGTLHPVQGKVMVGDKPAAGALVMFHAEAGDINNVPATGTVGPDGTFTLTTGTKAGAAAGRYVVTVVWPDPTKKPTEQQAMMGLAPDAPDLLGGRYGTRQKSPLRAEVKSGPNSLDPFDVK
jgi:hypothetical protein